MAISDADIDQFITLYAEEYSEQLSREDARPIAVNLINLFRLISQSPPNAVEPPSQNDRAMS